MVSIRMRGELPIGFRQWVVHIKRNVQNPYMKLTEEQLLQKLELSRQHAEQGKYRDADDVISDMRGKYGL